METMAVVAFVVQILVLVVTLMKCRDYSLPIRGLIATGFFGIVMMFLVLVTQAGQMLPQLMLVTSIPFGIAAIVHGFGKRDRSTNDSS